jgi:hypothetical protein
MKGTLWECYWELFENAIGNSLRTLWEHYIDPFYTLYKYSILYYIIHTLYCTLQWEVNYLSQHSTCILSIRFSLDNDYGTIIS